MNPNTITGALSEEAGGQLSLGLGKAVARAGRPRLQVHNEASNRILPYPDRHWPAGAHRQHSQRPTDDPNVSLADLVAQRPATTRRSSREAIHEPAFPERVDLMTPEISALVQRLDSLIGTLARKDHPELWTEEDIAGFYKMSVRTIKRTVALPGFPKPVGATDSDCGERRWFADEVIEYARDHRSGLSRARRQSSCRASASASAL